MSGGKYKYSYDRIFLFGLSIPWHDEEWDYAVRIRNRLIVELDRFQESGYKKYHVALEIYILLKMTRMIGERAALVERKDATTSDHHRRAQELVTFSKRRVKEFLRLFKLEVRKGMKLLKEDDSELFLTLFSVV